MSESTEEENRAKAQAQAQLESIIDLVRAQYVAERGETPELEDYEFEEGEDHEEKIRRIIQEDALSVQVRSGWARSGSGLEPEEYAILLCTGGPAVRISGDLGTFNEPETARIEYQDWYTPWEPLSMSSEERDLVLKYARNFYFWG